LHCGPCATAGGKVDADAFCWKCHVFSRIAAAFLCAVRYVACET
jgi:hypothetical protein